MSDVNEQTPAEVMTVDAPAPTELTQDLIAQLMPVDADGHVDGRNVHAFLEVETPYSKWFSRIVEKYDFADGTDFWTLDKFVQRADGTQMPKKRITHKLTLDVAKEACMVTNTDRARSARRYFIACEKRLRAGAPAGLTAEQVARLVDARMTPLVTCVTDLTRAVQSMLTARARVRNPGVMTVEEYTRSLGRRLTDGERSQVGRIATGMAKEAGIVPTQLAVPGSVKRTVNEYPLRFLVPALAEFDARRQVRKQTTHSPDFVKSCIEEDACRAKIGRPPIHTELVREFEEQQRAKAKVKSGHREKEVSGDGAFDV